MKFVSIVLSIWNALYGRSYKLGIKSNSMHFPGKTYAQNNIFPLSKEINLYKLQCSKI